jgi:hypothetical protein
VAGTATGEGEGLNGIPPVEGIVIIEPATIIWTHRNCRNGVIRCNIMNYNFVLFLFVFITSAGSVMNPDSAGSMLIWVTFS